MSRKMFYSNSQEVFVPKLSLRKAKEGYFLGKPKSVRGFIQD